MSLVNTKQDCKILDGIETISFGLFLMILDNGFIRMTAYISKKILKEFVLLKNVQKHTSDPAVVYCWFCLSIQRWDNELILDMVKINLRFIFVNIFILMSTFFRGFNVQ